ncbi:MAG TPA: aminoacyl-tRNA hydrolase [Actinomycetota bacterium]|jgi:PTH1 family peptidyl-tRNA hydrolase|nr:aminoacyl-tRNA hydrolase [Actinomycetota bacterium]
MAWLVAGLGNPGDRYARTRHNVGRMVAEDLADEAGERFRKVRFLPAETAEIQIGDERVLVVRSTRFMNESGPSYASLAKKHRIEPSRLIAVHDELDIPADTIRVKLGGGNSGHNGLRSLDQALRGPDYLRVRVGIGRPPGRQDPADFVLQPMGKREHEDLSLLVRHAAEAVRALITDGLERTQDRFNRSAPSP